LLLSVHPPHTNIIIIIIISPSLATSPASAATPAAPCYFCIFCDFLQAQHKVSDAITSIDGELCYNVGLAAPLDAAEADKMAWLLRETFEPQQLTPSSIFDGSAPNQCVVEVGPRTNFSTAFSTNATSITRSVGLDKVTRLEPSRRYLITSTR
jgi:phosphoribosylformylglycinamidine synthase